jgi:hypothetical protein
MRVGQIRKKTEKCVSVKCIRDIYFFVFLSGLLGCFSLKEFSVEKI